LGKRWGKVRETAKIALRGQKYTVFIGKNPIKREVLITQGLSNDGGGRRTRTAEGMSLQIYSLPTLIKKQALMIRRVLRRVLKS